MANTLTFTSAPFIQAVTFSAATSANTKYDILTADATNARRIYGISVTSTDGAVNSAKFHMHDGTNVFQMFMINIPANSGNTASIAPVDPFVSIYSAPLFAKQRDANGVPYFNVPATWKVQMEYTSALTSAEQLVVFTFGETYA